MSYGTVQAEKMTTESGYSLGAGNASSFKNRIINGNMTIDQRNAGASVTTSVLQSIVYTLDRWAYYNDVVSKRTIQQSSVAPAGFKNSLLVTVISTDTTGPQQWLAQVVEGLNISDLNWGTADAKPLMLSFWIRSSVTGQMGGSLQNSATNMSYPFAYTINSANTWEYKTVSITGPTTGTFLTTNGSGFRLLFENGPGFQAATAGSWVAQNTTTATGSVNLCATNGATWYITGVQVEVGTVATSFDFRSIGTELFLCQRYYQIYGAPNHRFLTSTTATSGFSVSNETLPVTMRTTPSITNPGNLTLVNIAANTTASVSVTVEGSGINSFRFYPNSGVSTSVIYLLTGFGTLNCSAEL